jgi:parallel beta-helix repeat protein
MHRSFRVPRQHTLIVALLLAAILSIIGIGIGRQTHAAQQAAAGREWHVAPNGNDGADGTRAAPLASPQKALDLVQPGETVVIQAGTYQLTRRLTFHDKAGTAGKPFVVRGEGMPTLRAPNLEIVPVWSGLLDIDRSSHVTVQGLRLENSGWFGIKVQDSPNVTLDGNQTSISLASAIYVNNSPGVKALRNDISRFCDQNERVRGSTCQEGISIVKTDGFEVGWNKVHSARQSPGVNPGGGEGIDAKEGSKNGSIYHNEVHDLVQLGIYVDAWDQLTENIAIYNNRIYNSSAGIVIGAENGGTVRNVQVYNNVIFNNGYQGISISNTSKNGLRENIRIYNNTVVGNGYTKNKPPWCVNYGCNDWGAGLQIDSTAIKDIVVHDNIFADNHSASISIAQGAEEAVKIDANLLWPVGQSWANPVTGNRPVVADPLFVDAAVSNYRLRAGSPAVGAGIGGVPLGVDADDKPRNPASVDLGAYAFQTGGGSTATATPPATTTPRAPSTTPPTTPPAGATPGVFLPLISKLTLFNAATDQPIGELKDGATLDLKQLGTNQLSVVATTNPTKVGSVTFALDGQVIQTENFVPYSIKGDAPKQGGRNYMPWTPTAGTHTLVVTPYSQAKGQGQAGTPMTVRFTVGSMTTSPRATSAPSATVTPTNPPATATPQGGATGATYYVSGNGNDTDTGRSETQAFRTLQKAADQTQPGDTVLVMNGEYTYPDPNNNILTINRSGTPDKWITYAAYPGHTPKLKSRNWQAISVQGVGYIVIEGFTIEGNRDEITYEEALAQKDNLNSPLTAGNCIGVSTVYNDPNKRSHHIMIRKNTVSKCPGAGIYTNHADYITIEDNVVYDNAFYSPYATSGISNYQNWNSDQSTGVKMIIRRNVIYRNQNLVPFYYSNSDPNKRNITDGNGIIIDDGRNTQDFSGNKGRPYTGRTLIENNLVYENGGRGIHVFLSDNVDIINNTTYRNSAHPDIKEGEITAIWADDVRVYNNIISARSDRPANMIAGTPGTPAGSETITFDYNLVYSGTGFTSDQPNNKVGVDPQFVDVDARDFTLQPESPAIDAGSSDPAAPDDLAGARRPQGKGVDIGAYEAR